MTEQEQNRLECFMTGLKRRNPGDDVFHQAVYEVALDILPFVEKHSVYKDAYILERLTEADRIIIFRVSWEDDEGNIRANRGYRVQHNNSIGPYKGGIRFHKNLTLSTLKFLAFEQTLKNSLTGLPMGGAKGGSDFNPKGKSTREVMRFCQAFMNELYRHIGPNTDVPAGDIGVGAREISYMFGQHKRITNEFTGALTGKRVAFGGSLIRTEASGYGVVYFAENMLQHHNFSLERAKAIISGSGNVALFTAEKLIEKGSKVVTMSDTSGFIYDPEGIDEEKLGYIKELKLDRRGRISEYVDRYKAEFHADKRPWSVPCDLAFPCATQNEINLEDATNLINNNCQAVIEGANMPTEGAAMEKIMASGLLFAPSKAANAGGVAVSGLEMTQNSMRLSWTRDELNQRLKDIMRDIHTKCVEHGSNKNVVNYRKGANITGFIKVADAMVSCGIV